MKELLSSETHFRRWAVGYAYGIGIALGIVIMVVIGYVK